MVSSACVFYGAVESSLCSLGTLSIFLATLLGCDAVGTNSNVAEFCYQPYEDLIQKAKVTSDQAERTKLYEEAQVIFKEQAPWATIAHSTVTVPMAKNVENFVIDPLGYHRFDGVDISE